MENLSKTLFKPTFHIQETSTIIHNASTKKNIKPYNEVMDGEQKNAWYRLLKFMLWAWQGLDLIDCYDVISHISASKNKRSNDVILDTVIGFRPGNWSYEWSQQASAHQNLAERFVKADQKAKSQDAYYKASQFFSVASYPHLRGDELSYQAQERAFNAYRESFKYHPDYILKEIKVPFQGKQVTCFLHLPNTETFLPVVIVSSGIDSLQCDFYPLFDKALAPAGIAMLTVDLPGVGYSSHVKLEQNASNLHQAIIHYLKEVPWVDHDRIGLMGMRFGGNIATRLAFIEPKKVKGVVCVGAAVGSIFNKFENFQKLPPVLLDCMASRMQVNNSSADILYQHCVPFSLTKQNLLRRKCIETPLLSIGHQNDIMCNKNDLTLIADSSRTGEAKIINKAPIFESYLKCLRYSAQWLTRHLAE